MANGTVPGELAEDVPFFEDVGDQPHPPPGMEVLAIGGDDPAPFLTAVLQSVEAKVGQVGSFFMTEDTEDAAFVVEFIVHTVGYLRFLKAVRYE
jgi:hypothetical protein